MFGFMRDEHDYGAYIHSLDTLLPPLVAACVLPSYVRPAIFAVAKNLIPSARKAFVSLDHIVTESKSCVAKRQSQMEAGGKIRNDLLAKLFAIKDAKGEDQDFKLPEIEQEAYVAL